MSFSFLPEVDTQNAITPDQWKQFAISPEQELWCAVIDRTVLDWRIVFRAIKGQIKKLGIYSKSNLYKYEALKHDLNDPWFSDICDLANVPHRKVLDLFDREARESGLFEKQSLVRLK